ncbi:hypothetical protein [Bradyrhizobium cosmicum]|uniref:hypothetical protein n=1 Tax=Bradyrhizobium cosmicum TaxID=1404864 RepID=UPI0028EC9CAE|nr:hypothetical protein [Bradyrhizobium cosmicum]
MPIAEIVRMAEAKHIGTIVDAAHSWEQLDFKVGELKTDLVGFNLHTARRSGRASSTSGRTASPTSTATWATKSFRRPTSARGCTLARSIAPPC